MQPPEPGYPPYRQSTFGPDPRYVDDLDERDLSWDSELDAPTDSDDENVKVLRNNPFNRPPPPQGPPPAIEDDVDDFATEPWNAVCVIGLRVFSKLENDVEVEVVSPGVSDKKTTLENGQKALDRDDPAVDHTKQASP